MKRVLVALITLFQFYSAASDSTGECIWYKQCDSKNNLNCAYSGSAKPLKNETALEFLLATCPDLDIGPKNETCCAPSLFYSMIDGLAVPKGFLKYCPSCYYTFAKLFCAMSCSRTNSKFIVPTSFKKWKNNQTLITAIDYFVTTEFAQGFYDSCKDVIFPPLQSPAITLLCGANKICSPAKLLYALGHAIQSPIPINFRIGNLPPFENIEPMNDKFYPCDAPFHNLSSCSCSDCPIGKKCVAADYPPDPKPWNIFGISGFYVVAIALFVGFVAIFVAAAVFLFFRKQMRKSARNTPERLLLDHEKIEPSCIEWLGAKWETLLQDIFCQIGYICAKYPFITLFIGIVITTALSAGIKFLTVTTNPVDLWSGKSSEAHQHLRYFNEHFGPFYRTSQIIITRTNGKPIVYKDHTFSKIFDLDFLNQVLDLQEAVQNLAVDIDHRHVTLKDICIKPMYPEFDECLIMTPLGYFQNNRTTLKRSNANSNHLDHINSCTLQSASITDNSFFNATCLGAYGGPILPFVALGGYENSNYLSSESIGLTFLINNYNNQSMLKNATTWEKKYIDFLKNYNNPNMSIAFLSESSPENELARESKGDLVTVIISYTVMFLYVSFALGHYKSIKTIFVDSKMTLAMGGVLIVMLSVLSSIGFFCYLKVPATLIIIEVVPFLVLAVGVDNIFILVQALQRDSKPQNESQEEQIGRILGKVGPSMLLSSCAEAVCFFLGALSDMPAVHIFALYSGFAILVDFLLQITCFVALLSLDSKRQNMSRYDLLCCFRSKEEPPLTDSKSFLYRFFQDHYAPFLMKDFVRGIVLFLFTALVCCSVASVNKIEPGLDQQVSMPSDSYLQKFFEYMAKYSRVGAPVYFVIKDGFDYTKMDTQNLVCSTIGCEPSSVVSQLNYAGRMPEKTHFKSLASSWLDSYIMWYRVVNCCQTFKNDSDTFCPSTYPDQSECEPCEGSGGKERPKGELFDKYLKFFLEDNPSSNISQCSHGGHPAFYKFVEMKNGSAGASAFMMYQSVSKTSQEYTESLKWARIISSEITKAVKLKLANMTVKNEIKNLEKYNFTNINDTTETIIPDEPTVDFEVFPFSILYVYYEQYITIWKDSIKSLGISATAVFIVVFVLMGFDILSSVLIIFTIAMIIFDLFGLMAVWNINLNAVSLVNLVMAMGISVEFCAHIARSFATNTKGSRKDRAQHALATTGSSVLSGITLTKFGGITVLAFSKSQIFQVYYFRMYFGIILFGAAHGLIFLPVLLSFLGPSINKEKLIKEQRELLSNGNFSVNDSKSEEKLY